MATQSFMEMLVIDTPEKAGRLLAAFKEYEKRGALELNEKSILDDLKEGEEHLRSNPL